MTGPDKSPHIAKQLVLESLTLRTSRGRIIAWATLTCLIVIAPYSWLANLSIWQHVGLNWAPSIGLTRAYWLVLHGHPVDAWHRNKLIYLVLAVGLPLIIHDLVHVIRHRSNYK